MNQQYLFKTERLGFRTVTESDFNYLLILSVADPESWNTDPNEIDEKIKNDITYFRENGYGAFLVFELESTEFIGRAGFGWFGDDLSDEIEVGYVVLEKYRNKGYATEMLKGSLSWAKEHINKDRILAITSVNHSVSEKVMQNAGMTFYKREKIDGVDSVIYEYML